MCCCLELYFLPERWEGGAVIACVFGRSLKRVNGKRTTREMRGIVTLSLFLCVFSWELQDSVLNGGGGGCRGKQVFFGHV